MQSDTQKKRMNDTCIKLYHKIVAFRKQFGYAPTARELCKLMDVGSTSQIAFYLDILEQWHWIETTDGKGRTMRLTRPTERDVPTRIRQAATVMSDRMAEEERQP